MPNKAQDDDLVIGLVENALRLPSTERAAYVRNACGDDPEVCCEALRLVSQAKSSGTDFLSNGPVRLMDVLERGPMPKPHFSAGQMVAGRFSVLEFLNSGGMGEVYAAMDLELEEKIALKIGRAHV